MDPETGARAKTGHRLHIRVPARTAADLLARAASHGLTVSAAARQLIQLGLTADTGDSPVADHAIVAMSALVAAEHTVLMVASILPEGEQRMHSLAERAAEAAEQRLALIAQAREEL